MLKRSVDRCVAVLSRHKYPGPRAFYSPKKSTGASFLVVVFHESLVTNHSSLAVVQQETSESSVTTYVTINGEDMSAVGVAQPFPEGANHIGWMNFWRRTRV